MAFLTLSVQENWRGTDISFQPNEHSKKNTYQLHSQNKPRKQVHVHFPLLFCSGNRLTHFVYAVHTVGHKKLRFTAKQLYFSQQNNQQSCNSCSNQQTGRLRITNQKGKSCFLLVGHLAGATNIEGETHRRKFSKRFIYVTSVLVWTLNLHWNAHCSFHVWNSRIHNQNSRTRFDK